MTIIKCTAPVSQTKEKSKRSQVYARQARRMAVPWPSHAKDRISIHTNRTATGQSTAGQPSNNDTDNIMLWKNGED